MSDVIKDYLNSIARYPLLTTQQEVELGRRVARWRELKEKEGKLTEQERTEFRSGERARRRFIQSNLQLVVHVARRYDRKDRHMDLMDLVQEGNIGLAKAVELFDHTRGYKFSTYAFWWIRQAIIRGMYQYDATIRLPVCIHERLNKARKSAERLAKELGRQATITEIADDVGIPAIDLSEIFKRSLRVTSIDLPVGNDESATLGDTIPSPDHSNQSLSAEDQVLMEQMLSYMDSYLDERTRDVLLSQDTKAQIAERHGISKFYTYEIRNRGLQRLRMLMGDPLAGTPLGTKN
jgi:RNA polymerase sigma factor (sigma-70 family)